ncbi:inhibitor of growth protein 1-like [Ptychodera flava]|uniref:inhibitor of growth protein 1-like n=1 Tax=Ptychodera flava TaxID=63121 RepID=UPI00396A9EF1
MSKLEIMLNQQSQEVQYQAAYVEDYLDCVESLPNDLQRNVSQLREIDSEYQGVLKEIDHYYTLYKKKSIDCDMKKIYLIQIQRNLVRSQELGDEKLQLCSQMVDLVENSQRKLETDFEQLESGNEKNTNHAEPSKPEHHERSGKRSRRQRNHENKEKDRDGDGEVEKKTKKKKRSKSKAERERESSPAEIVIDPNEPTYCLCNQVSYGEMIGCDNVNCELEWFHFNCVGLTSKPKGKWYCPRCAPERKKGHSR